MEVENQEVEVNKSDWLFIALIIVALFIIGLLFFSLISFDVPELPMEMSMILGGQLK